MTALQLPAFENPPVVEVVCGIAFRELSSLLGAHLGSLWDKFRADYPTCKEVPPLASIIERAGPPDGVQFELTDTPPMARTWFIHKHETGIVQVQRDRFFHNWKKTVGHREYPRYATVMRLFRERLADFELFLDQNQLGDLAPMQYELTYVNHIPLGDGWESLRDVGAVFPDFCFRREGDRFLPTPEAIHWRTVFQLPDNAGRLHATIRHAIRSEDGTPLLQLELTARGMPPDPSRDAMWNWMDLAHEWIVRGFVDLTGDRVSRQIWRQQA